MKKARDEIEERLIKGGMEEADAVLLTGRLLEEEAEGYIEFRNDFDKYLSTIDLSKFTNVVKLK